MPYFLGIDLGTQSIKVAFYNPETENLFWNEMEYQIQSGFNMEGYLERDVEMYWESMIAVIKNTMSEKKIKSDEIKALSFSVLGETFVPTDENFKPLRSAFSGHDIRGSEEALFLKEKFGNDVLQKISGQPDVEVIWPAVKILWFKNNQPGLFKKTKRYLNVEDYIINKLTGKFVTENTMLCSTLYYDISKLEWYQPMLDFLNIDLKLLPEVKSTCEVIDNISREAAKTTGLSTKTLVVAGAMDQIAGATGAGNIEPGILTETTGTSLALGITFKGGLEDINKNIPYYFHSIKDGFFLLPWSPSGGITLKWVKDIFFSYEKRLAEDSGQDIYKMLDGMAAKIPAGAEGLIVLPYILGSACPHSNPNAKLVFFGLTLNHGKPHIVRAVLEATAYLIRENLEAIKKFGVEFKKIISLGGGSKSPLWCQIKSDICNIQVETLKYGDLASSIGACFFAAVGTGHYKSIDYIKNSPLLTSKNVFNPNKENSEIYNSGYKKFKTIYQRSLDIF